MYINKICLKYPQSCNYCALLFLCIAMSDSIYNSRCGNGLVKKYLTVVTQSRKSSVSRLVDILSKPTRTMKPSAAPYEYSQSFRNHCIG